MIITRQEAEDRIETLLQKYTFCAADREAVEMALTGLKTIDQIEKEIASCRQTLLGAGAAG